MSKEVLLEIVGGGTLVSASLIDLRAGDGISVVSLDLLSRTDKSVRLKRYVMCSL